MNPLRPFRRSAVFLSLACPFLLAAASSWAGTYHWTNLAGLPGGRGVLDGIGSAAQFNNPNSVAVDSGGNVYVADHESSTIRKISSTGVVTTLAGSPGLPGDADGTGPAARFNWPQGIAVDGSSTVYVADTGNNTIRKITSAGVVTTFAGTPWNWGSADGTGTAAQFSNPHGIAADAAGNLFVADTGNHTIRKITSAGVVTTLAGRAGVPGSTNGTSTGARFNWPQNLALDGSGNIYVADTGNSTIRKVTSTGVVTTMAGSPGLWGSTDGTGSAARFSGPSGIAASSSGTLYVADSGANTIRKITSAGVVTTFAGSAWQSGSTNGTGSAARFSYPYGIALNSSGTLFVSDAWNNTIRKVSSTSVVTTLAGSPANTGSANGSGSSARFLYPRGVAVDSGDTVYVTDTSNSTIRKITSAGAVTTLAGSAGLEGSDDGATSLARFRNPSAIAVTGDGTLLVADSQNHTIRKITAEGEVSTFAGAAELSGSDDGSAAEARFMQPQGIAVDGSGNVYVADTGNHTIRKIAGDGTVSTVAGSPGSSGSNDGSSTLARFYYPNGIVVDELGNLFVTDSGNGTIRRIDRSGEVATLAGTPGTWGHADGSGAAAQFENLTGLGRDSSGNLFVTEESSHTIRMITNSGVVTTIGGAPSIPGGTDGYAGNARFSRPGGIAVSSSGTLFVADTDNNRVARGLWTSVSAPTVAATGTSTTGTSAVAGGSITASGGSSVTERGVVFAPAGVNSDPQIGGAGVTKVIASGVSSIFTVSLPGLTEGTEYSYKTYAINGAGTGYSEAATFHTGTYQWTSFAGLPGGYGTADPRSVAVDGDGTVYVAAGDHAIRKISSAGSVSVLAGTPGSQGWADGTGGAAGFDSPSGVAVDGEGTVYVADTDNHSIRKITPAGVVTTLAGQINTPGNTDGNSAIALFDAPCGIAVDAAGTVYVADTGNHTIRRISNAGVVATLAGSAGLSGSSNGSGGSARFSSPHSLAVDGSGNLYVADTGNHLIRKVSPAGLVTTLAGSPGATGSADGNGSAARFSFPDGIAVDGSGNVYVADTGDILDPSLGNHTIRAISPNGDVITLAGSPGNYGYADGSASAARFHFPRGIAVDAAGNLYVGDWLNVTIRKINASAMVTTLAGTPGYPGDTDASGSAARFFWNQGVAVDAGGNVYVADSGNNLIRKIDTGGAVSPLAGASGLRGSADGSGASARFDHPSALAVDGAGVVFVADTANHAIRKITSDGQVATLAGNPANPGHANGQGDAAGFDWPQGIALDAAGNVYVADSLNHTIRKITSAGLVSTLAGSAGVAGSTDGAAGAARFFFPSGVAVDSAGNVYVADSLNHTIRKITSSGVVSTLAGVAGDDRTVDGPLPAARFDHPTGVAVDGTGNLFVTSWDQTVRKISAGVVTTIGGRSSNFLRDWASGLGSAARFSLPWGIAVSPAGDLFVADVANNHVAKASWIPPDVAATAPTVTSPTISAISGTSAILGGNAAQDGGGTIQERGVLYSVTAANNNPLEGGSGVTKVTTVASTGVFTIPVTGLSPGTPYTFKAFAKNSGGTGYSPAGTFTTPSPTGVIATPVAGSPLSGTAITFTWTAGSSAKGYWLYVGNAPGAKNYYDSGQLASTVLSRSVSGLPSNGTTVYVRLFSLVGSSWLSQDFTFTAYTPIPLADFNAIQSLLASLKSTAEGHDLAGFLALFSPDYLQSGDDYDTFAEDVAEHLPLVTGFNFPNPQLALLDATTATATGTLTLSESTGQSFTFEEPDREGGLGIGWLKKEADGHWRVIGNGQRASHCRVYTGNNLTDGNAFFRIRLESPSPITSTLVTGPGIPGTPLEEDADYGGFTAFVTPSSQVAPGTEYSVFIHYLHDTEEIITTPVYSWVQAAPQITVTGGGSLMRISWTDVSSQVPHADHYRVSVEGEGVSWSSQDLPLTTTSVTFNQDGTATGALTLGQTYSVFVTITNDTGDYAYRIASYTQPGPSQPTVVSPSSASITSTTATLGGQVTSDGGADVTARGVVYSVTSVNSNPLIGGTGVLLDSASGSTGIFTFPVAGLAAATAYSFRAWASNSEGTAYSPVATFSTAGLKAEMATPAPSSVLASTSVPFTWNAGAGATAYWLYVGSTLGASNYHNSGQLATTSLARTVSGLPVNGSTVYVRLYSKLNGAWVFNDYTYTAVTATKATLTSPANGSTLSSSSVTFTWNAGTGATGYWLYLGSSPGAKNYHDSGQLASTVLSRSVTGLPTSGGAVFARLWTQLSGSWVSNDYLFTAYTDASPAAKAAMASPVQGTTLAGASQLFTWNPGNRAAGYWLYAGSTVGAKNYHDSGQLATTALSRTVTGLPLTGATVYVRLYTKLNGAWLFTDYTYTAASGKAVITSPLNGSTLPAGPITFSWSAGAGAGGYWLYAGSSPGAFNYHNSGSLSASILNRSVNGLPANGSPVFVRLYTKIGSAWQYNDYLYQTSSD